MSIHSKEDRKHKCKQKHYGTEVLRNLKLQTEFRAEHCRQLPRLAGCCSLSAVRNP